MQLSDFVSLVTLHRPLDAGEIDRLTRHSCLDIHRVQWLRCYLAKDSSRMLCWYRAPDAESVRLVLRHQDLGSALVWPVRVAAGNGLATPEPADLLVAEYHRGEPNPGGAAIDEDAAKHALEAAGLTLYQGFSAVTGQQEIGIVVGGDEFAVHESLQAAGSEAGKLWPCVMYDTRPARLFEDLVSPADVPAATRPGMDSLGEPRNGIAALSYTDELDALVIGAGVSGICMLQRLLAMGLRARACESAADVGGVWYWNRYPGARVDSETYTYGFSFSDDLLRDWDWRELFAPRDEIYHYLRHVVKRCELGNHIDLNTRLESAVFDEKTGRWLVDTSTGIRHSVRYLIAATGSLSTPQMPDFPGIEDFAGPSFHTARWPESGVDLTGRRVGVVGTGASGVQVIQTIADQVGQLLVFQRTPNYCIPQRNRVLRDDDRCQIRDSWKDILAACNSSYSGFIHSFDPRSGLAVTAREREEKFEELWQQPGFAFWFSNFADLMMNLEVNSHASEFVRRKIRERVLDPEVADKLLPDHPFGTKRVPLENGYYEVFNRDNVQLIDTRDTPVEQVTEAGIRTSKEEYPLDIIVYATGFDAGTGALNRINLRGRNNRLLADKWRPGPKTFLGLLVNEFPNLFIVNGPQNAAALCNAVRCVEQNVDWIARCIGHMRQRNLTFIEPVAAAEDEWTAHVNDAAEGSVLGQMKESWFFGANTPGKARQATIYAPGARAYREHCEEIAKAGYLGCTMY